MSRETANTNMVVALAAALNRDDPAAARPLLADDLRFVGVFGPPLDGADTYLQAMSRLGGQQKVLHCVAEGDDVACFYELSVPARPDIVLFGCGWFAIEDGRIKSIRVVFDPTPLGKP